MKKCTLSFLCIFLLSGYMSFCAAQETSLELRPSAFFHSGKRFREVYASVGPTIGIEVSKRFCKRYAAWIDVDYLKEKSDENGCCKTSLGILNTSLGVRYLYPLGCLCELYVGIGPTFSWVDLKNHTCCGHEHFSRLAVGGVVKTGLYYRFYRDYFIDVFVDYLYQSVHIGHSIDIGGLKLGIGIGTQF